MIFKKKHNHDDDAALTVEFACTLFFRILNSKENLIFHISQVFNVNRLVYMASLKINQNPVAAKKKRKKRFTQIM